MVHVLHRLRLRRSQGGAIHGRGRIAPLGYYGLSKLRGEAVVRELAEALVARTSWAAARWPGRQQLPQGARMDAPARPLRVAVDQLGSPTYAPHLAEGILELVRGRAPPGCSTWPERAAPPAGNSRERCWPQRGLRPGHLRSSKSPPPSTRQQNRGAAVQARAAIPPQTLPHSSTPPQPEMAPAKQPGRPPPHGNRLRRGGPTCSRRRLSRAGATPPLQLPRSWQPRARCYPAPWQDGVALSGRLTQGRGPRGRYMG